VIEGLNRVWINGDLAVPEKDDGHNYVHTIQKNSIHKKLLAKIRMLNHQFEMTA